MVSKFPSEVDFGENLRASGTTWEPPKDLRELQLVQNVSPKLNSDRILRSGEALGIPHRSSGSSNGFKVSFRSRLRKES